MLNRSFRFLALAATVMVPSFFLHAQDADHLQNTAAPTISFSAPQGITLNSDPSQDAGPVLGGDLNGDGNTDLIAVYGNPAAYHTLLGDGKGHFTEASANPPNNLYSGNSPYATVALVDLNGDGKLDILQVYPGYVDPQACDSSPTTVTVWLGDGKGGFAAPVTYDLEPADVVYSTYGDFNGDGKIDVAVYTYSPNDNECGIGFPSLNILLNNGDGTYASPQINSAASFRSKPEATVLGSQSAAPPKSSNTVSGSSKSPNTVSGFGMMVSGDFNGDGKVDLVMGFPIFGQPGNIHLFYGDGQGNFQPSYNYTVDSQLFSMAATDLNGDGKTDLVLGLSAKDAPGAHPRIATLLAKQSEGFYWAYGTALPDISSTNTPYPQILALTDLNGDRKLDVVVQGEPSSYMLVLPGEGGGEFGAPENFSAGSLYVTSTIMPFKNGGLPNVFLLDAGFEKSSTTLYYLANESQ